jgi:serine/threonine protein phosphatase PrpC
MNIINLGDCRLVIVYSNGNCKQVTTDHKPDDPKEKIRIGGSNSAETLRRMKPVFCITNGTTYKSVTEVVKMLNVHRVSVTNCCNKKSHTAGGYKFEWGTK